MSTERRRYFRIDDSALLRYRTLPAAELDSMRARIAEGHLEADNLRTALEPLDARLAEMMPAARRESRVLAEALDLINRKLTLVAGALAHKDDATSDSRPEEHQPHSVNLGGGGLALRAERAIPAGSWLLIDLVLLPANHALRAIGRVTDVRSGEGEFIMGIEFDALREADRDALIGHALRKQAQRLREERDARRGRD